jgi:hypothetical protein
VTAVSEAEAALGLKVRPVYAYVGDLHPALGKVGLIISHRWYRRRPLGVSRCDTGGLVGRIGGFNCLKEAGAAKRALRKLTMKRRPDWSLWFRFELFRSHGGLDGWRRYLRGHPPSRALNDERDLFIKSVPAPADRRLWTWEARSDSPIQKGDVLAIALTAEAAKLVLKERRANPSVFKKINLLVGSATGGGVSHFDEENVVLAFMGRQP